MSACATVSDAPPSVLPSWPSSNQWQATGVVGIKTTQGADTVYVTWRQQGDRFQLSFTSSLGTHIAQLHGVPGHITLIDADGHTHQASDPDQLANTLLGWPLPISGLQYWIRGLPAPGPYQKTSPSHWQQHGWQLDYQQFRTVDKITVPTRLTLQRHGIAIRIIVKKWSIQPR